MRTRVLLFLAATAVQTHSIFAGMPSPGITAHVESSRKSQIRRIAAPELDVGAATAKADAVWKDAGADEGLRKAFDRAMYSLSGSGNGTWRGQNRAQRLSLEFDEQEARLHHPGGGVAFHLTGYGYGDRLRRPERAKVAGAPKSRRIRTTNRRMES